MTRHSLFHRLRSPSLSLLLLLPAALFLPNRSALAQTAALDAARQLATAEDKGHCQACHQFPNDSRVKSRATVGPALAAMRTRFPDRARLMAVIRDARSANADTIMPPYGPHRILTESEMAAIADYLLTQ